MEKYKVGIVGATGMVGQRFITLLSEHPWFEITCLAASGRSAGRTYREAAGTRWAFDWDIPANVADMVVEDAADVNRVAEMCDFVFCAVNMDKAECKAMEEAYARAETPVVSNNSANRWTPDVPMLIPEINFAHAAVIEHQRARLGTKRGFVAVKPNCSIQGYVPRAYAPARFRHKAGVSMHLSGHIGRGQDVRDLARNARQRNPVHRRRGGKERARTPAHMGQGRGRRNRAR